MRKTIGYVTVTGHIDEFDALLLELEKDVNNLEGWNPVGTASISANNYRIYIVQTMEKNEPEGPIHTDLPSS